MTLFQATERQPSRYLTLVFLISALLLVAVAAPGRAGEASIRLAMSAFIVPLQEADVSIPSATVDIRLPKPDGHWVTVHTEYEMRNNSDSAIRLRVALPCYGGFAGFFAPSESNLQPAIKLDGVPLAYSYLRTAQLAEPFLQEWEEKGWRLLEATDPELYARLRAVKEKGGLVSHGQIQSLTTILHPSADKWGDRARHWSDSVVKFLVARENLEFEFWGPTLTAIDVRDAMRFLDPQYDFEAYDLGRLLLDQWDFHTAMLRDAYDGRLYEGTHDIDPHPHGFDIRVLEFEVTLLPGLTHHLAVFYRQQQGFDNNTYRPGDLPSRQFCFAINNADKWSEWRWIHWIIRWPEGTKRISFPAWRENKRHWREEGYHNASFSSGLYRNMHIAWTKQRAIQRRSASKVLQHNECGNKRAYLPLRVCD